MKKLTDIIVNLQNSPITEASFNDMPVPFPDEDRVSIALNHLSQIGEMVDDLYNTLSGLEEIDNAVALALTSAYNCTDDLYTAVEETYGIEPVEDLDDEADDEEMDESYELDEGIMYYFMNKSSGKVRKIKANNDADAYAKMTKINPIGKETLDYEKMKSPIEFYKKYWTVRREIQKEEFAEAVADTFNKKKMAPADSANTVPPKLKSLGFKAADPSKDTWMPTKGNVVQLFGIPMRAGKWADVFFAVTDDAKPYTVITDEGVTRFKNERDAITYMMAGDMTEDVELVEFKLGNLDVDMVKIPVSKRGDSGYTSYGYSPGRKSLYIDTNLGVIKYVLVPATVFDELEKSDNIVNYVKNNVKGKFRSEMIKVHNEDVSDLTEVLSKDAPASEWIDDFVKSDAPQFKGKSKKERIKMALGAYYGAQKKESVDLTEGVLDIIKKAGFVDMPLRDEPFPAPHVAKKWGIKMRAGKWADTVVGQYKDNSLHPWFIYSNDELEKYGTDEMFIKALNKMTGTMKKEDLELDEAKMTPQQKNDAQRVQYGAMSKDDYNKKYKLGKYKAGGNPLAGPGGLYKNLVKRPMGEDLEEGVFFPKYPKDATVDDKIRIAKTFIANTKQAIAKDEKDIEGAKGVDGIIQWSKIKGVGASLSDNKANLAAAEKRLAKLEKEKTNK